MEISKDVKNYIICFLTVKPNKLFYDFCKQLKNKNYDIYICIDDNSYNIPDYDNEIKIIKLDNELCQKNGFKSCVLKFNNKACSRDKALYYFCKENINYDHIWFIEEDVFIPNKETIINIDKRHKNINCDLLCASNHMVYEKQKNWHWKHINNQIKINPPYAKSMICAIRCSKKLLNCINNYAKKHNNLFMDEALFNTLAYHNNLNVITPYELFGIVFRHNWELNKIKKDCLYHPIKNIDIQVEYRKKLN